MTNNEIKQIIRLNNNLYVPIHYASQETTFYFALTKYFVPSLMLKSLNHSCKYYPFLQHFLSYNSQATILAYLTLNYINSDRLALQVSMKVASKYR